ncbi:hypothetical protein FNF28_03818 [Cafeteria roenbergensis]|uniref:Origin recognition complex subunit 3 winged helix C-terminal domain-containing protein n=1 Tax=Cafeteria roenbergensis TaxID=33653 RepID=A0A5A8DGU8_CAFRO|nr:hypothetical protein FNF28_03818 [Cafeteria roenbergensis]
MSSASFASRAPAGYSAGTDSVAQSVFAYSSGAELALASLEDDQPHGSGQRAAKRPRAGTPGDPGDVAPRDPLGLPAAVSGKRLLSLSADEAAEETDARDDALQASLGVVDDVIGPLLTRFHAPALAAVQAACMGRDEGREVPTVVLFAGLNVADHSGLFRHIASRLREDVSPMVVQLRAADCQSANADAVSSYARVPEAVLRSALWRACACRVNGLPAAAVASAAALPSVKAERLRLGETRWATVWPSSDADSAGDADEENDWSSSSDDDAATVAHLLAAGQRDLVQGRLVRSRRSRRSGGSAAAESDRARGEAGSETSDEDNDDTDDDDTDDDNDDVNSNGERAAGKTDDVGDDGEGDEMPDATAAWRLAEHAGRSIPLSLWFVAFREGFAAGGNGRPYDVLLGPKQARGRRTAESMGASGRKRRGAKRRPKRGGAAVAPEPVAGDSGEEEDDEACADETEISPCELRAGVTEEDVLARFAQAVKDLAHVGAIKLGSNRRADGFAQRVLLEVKAWSGR